MLDRRLVAHLLADEPAGNALLVARQYTTDPRRRARAVSDLDWVIAPEPEPIALDAERELTDAAGTRYRLTLTTHDGVRWTRRGVGEDRAAPIALRAVIGALQDYEPARCMTRAALATPEQTARLAFELDDLAHSPRVLNRRLRERVLMRVARGEDTLSHIALRCGRRKMRSDFAGHVGDTAWLRRRIGDAPEAGKTRPCAWIHHELLGRIARDGLGVDPHEVELA